MRPADRDAYVERYEERLRRYGHSPLTLGWGKPGREHVRFRVFAELIEEIGAESVLDVGCGFADFHDHLRAGGWSGHYAGIDIVPGLLAEARRRHPDLDLAEADIAEFELDEAQRPDILVASGMFNARLQAEENPAHIERSVARMFELSRRAVGVDFMSTFVDFQRPEAWHTDPAWAIGLARGLSPRFRLRHDYMPFEFALMIYRDDEVSDNVFRAARDR